MAIPYWYVPTMKSIFTLGTVFPYRPKTILPRGFPSCSISKNTCSHQSIGLINQEHSARMPSNVSHLVRDLWSAGSVLGLSEKTEPEGQDQQKREEKTFKVHIASTVVITIYL